MIAFAPLPQVTNLREGRHFYEKSGRLMASDRRATYIPLLVTLGLVALSLVALDRPLVRGDGLAYYMWLDSIAGDGDMDLSNQAERFAHVNAYQIFYYEPTERFASVFAYGGALLWTPFQKTAASMDGLGWLHVNDEHFWTFQGVLFPYSFMTMLGTNLMALAAIVLAYKSARLFAPPGVSALASLMTFWGTPALYYSTIEPLNTHVPGMLLTALLVYGWLKLSQKAPDEAAPGGALSNWGARRAHALDATLLRFFFLGLVAGLATLVRWQLALHIAPIGLIMVYRIFKTPYGRWRDLLAFSMGFLAFVWHLMYTWNWMFGSPLVVPAQARGHAGFLGPPVHLLKVLFSDERGLFVWSPLTLLATLGLIGLARRRSTEAHERHRGQSAVLMGMFALQALMNAGVVDWWGGWSFGMRRMTELYPIFVIGLAVFLDHLPPLASSWPALYRAATRGLAALALGFSLLLLLSHLNFINTVPDKPQGDSASTEVHYQLTQSNFRTTWLVIKDHYGIWAWQKPGP